MPPVPVSLGQYFLRPVTYLPLDLLSRAVAKIRFRRGAIPMLFKTSAGSHVSTEPVSTTAGNGWVSSSSRFGLRAMTLT